MKKRFLTILLCGVFAAGMLTGCREKEEAIEVMETPVEIVEPEVVEPEEEVISTVEEPEYAAIGEKEGATHMVLLTNSTGADIVGFAIYDEESEDFGDNLLEEEDSFADEETREFYYTDETEADEEGEDVAEETEVMIDIKITLADETTYVLHAFPLDEAQIAEIMIDEVSDVAYIEYNDGESTLEAELALITDETDDAEEEQEEEQETSDNGATVNQSSESCVGSDAPVTQGGESCVGTSPTIQGSTNNGGSNNGGGTQTIPSAPVVEQGGESCVGGDAPTTGGEVPDDMLD